MKIQLFWSYYDQYIRKIYLKSKIVSTLSYEKQLEIIMADNFGWILATIERLKGMGHEVEVILANVEPLQRAWARENGRVFNNDNWQYELPLKQIEKFQPDIVWIGSMFNYFGDYLKQVKSHCRKIFAWTACPLPNSLNLDHIDCFLTSHTNYQDFFRSRGKACEILLPAFNEEIITSVAGRERDIECSFVGALSWAHIERIKTVRALADNTPIQIWGDRPKLLSRGILKPRFISSYLSLYPIRERIRPSVWGMDMYDILARSQITINVHGEVASGLAGNMRMFEATGMGALLITEEAPNIHELYEPGVELVTYKNIGNLIDLVNYYTTHPLEREDIARAGRARTIKSHGINKRAVELVEIFNRYLNL